MNDLNRLAESMSSYAQAAHLAPQDPLARWNLALVHLKAGNLLEGWRLYEYGWLCDKRGKPRQWSQPLWLGDTPLQGKTILLHAEQGLGDTLQFMRYIQKVRTAGGFAAPTWRTLSGFRSALPSFILASGFSNRSSQYPSGKPIPAQFTQPCAALVNTARALQTPSRWPGLEWQSDPPKRSQSQPAIG